MTVLSRYGRRRTWWMIAALAVVVVILGRAMLHKPASAATGQAAPAVTVDTASASRADVPIYLQGLGTVQAFYTVTVTARVDGELQRVAFTEGQTVHKGDLLAQIDPRPNQAAFDQAVATKAKDEAQLANAKRDLERYTKLQPQDLASKQTVDTQRALVDQLAAQLKVDQAVIDNARTQLEYTRITSPIDGRTGIRLVDPGNIVHAADTTGIVVVTQLQPIRVVFTLPEEQLGAVAAGARGRPGQCHDRRRATVGRTRRGHAGADRQPDRSVDGHGATQGDLRQRPQHALAGPVRQRARPGPNRTHALTIPNAAVQLGPNGPFTYVVKPTRPWRCARCASREGGGGLTIVEGRPGAGRARRDQQPVPPASGGPRAHECGCVGSIGGRRTAGRQRPDGGDHREHLRRSSGGRSPPRC